MNFFVDLMRDGGPVMWLLLLLALPALPVALGAAVLAGLGRRVPLATGVVLPLLMVLAGALGAVTGAVQVVEAVVYASAELKGTLAHAGMHMALIPESTGLMLAGSVLLVNALGSGVVSVVARGDHAAEVQAEHRLGAALSATLGVLALACGWALLGEMRVHQALAYASAETMGVLVAAGAEHSQRAVWLGAFGVMVGVVGAAACVPVARHIPRTRAAVSGLVVGLAVLLSAVLHGVVMQTASPLSTVWPATALAGIDDVAANRPVPRDLDDHVHSLPPAYAVDATRVWSRGQWKPWGPGEPSPATSDGPTTLLLAAPATTPATAITQASWRADTTHFAVLVSPASPGLTDGPSALDELRYRAWTVDWAQSAAHVDAGPNSLFLHPGKYGREVVLATADGARLWTGQLDVVGPELRARFDALNPGQALLWLDPADSWTLQDLVSMCLQLNDPTHSTGGRRCGIVGPPGRR